MKENRRRRNSENGEGRNDHQGLKLLVSTIVLLKRERWHYSFCVDYHKLKDVTDKDTYPLPRIDDILDPIEEKNTSVALTSPVTTGRLR